MSSDTPPNEFLPSGPTLTNPGGTPWVAGDNPGDILTYTPNSKAYNDPGPDK